MAKAPRSWTAHPTVRLRTNAKGAWEQEPSPQSTGPCWAVCACQMPVFTPLVTHLVRLHATACLAGSGARAAALQSPLWHMPPENVTAPPRVPERLEAVTAQLVNTPAEGRAITRRPSCDYRGFSLPKDVIQFHGYLGL